MKKKIFNHFLYFGAAGISTLALCFFSLPYLNVVIRYENEIYSKMSINGYELMNLCGFGFFGVMTSLIQIFILTLTLMILILGLCGVLKTIGILKDFPNKLGKYDTDKVLYSSIIMYFGLTCLLLICLIVLAVTSRTDFVSYSYRLRLNIGIFMMLIQVIGGIIAINILPEKILSESK